MRLRTTSFKTDGFLSPEMERFRSSLRGVDEYKLWFDFAEDLNRLAFQMLEGHEVPLTDNQRLMISALFVRAHKSFQAAIILAEKGLLGDARCVLRSAVEGAVALNALANDAAFVDQLINAHHFNQRKMARLLLGNSDYRTTYSPEQISEMANTITQVDAIEATVGKLDINWADVARKHCKDLYDLLYRSLSSDGTHTTIDAIHRMVDYASSGEIESVKAGPDIAGMSETLQAACLMLLWAADPFARAFGPKELTDRIREKLQKLSQLPQKEPSNVAVVANFGL